MKKPKVLIVYKSIHHQNTLKIAEFLKRKLRAKLVEAEKGKGLNLADYDLIGFNFSKSNNP